jgi:uncharacterized protein YwgA
VASAEAGLTTRDTVLLIVRAAGDSVQGRTVMQKLSYFSGLELSASPGHRAHYYGPYSSRVEDALNLAVVAGDLHELVERYPDWYGSGPDTLKYTYQLTDAGKAKALELAEEHAAEWERIEHAVAAIRTVIPDLNQKTLSSAAKTYLIVSESDETVQEDHIPQLAEKLGLASRARRRREDRQDPRAARPARGPPARDRLVGPSPFRGSSALSPSPGSASASVALAQSKHHLPEAVVSPLEIDGGAPTAATGRPLGGRLGELEQCGRRKALQLSCCFLAFDSRLRGDSSGVELLTTSRCGEQRHSEAVRRVEQRARARLHAAPVPAVVFGLAGHFVSSLTLILQRMRLVPELERPAPWLEAPSTPRRLRPGERPAWVDLGPDTERLARWRAVAAACRLPVEVVLAVLLEHALVSEDLDQAGVPAGELDRVAERELRQPRLAPTAALQGWLAQLAGTSRAETTPSDDELPEAALPERLLQRVGRCGELVEDMMDTAKLERALLWERAAALQGMCMSGWALRAALRLEAYPRPA